MEFKYRIDSQLEDRLKRWHEQIDVLHQVEIVHLSLEAQKDSLFGALFLKLEGSIAEKTAKVHSSDDWVNFMKGMTMAKVEWLKEKRTLELKMKAYEATYITFKIESEAVRKSNG